MAATTTSTSTATARRPSDDPEESMDALNHRRLSAP